MAGLLQHGGPGVEPDLVRAAELLRLAAERGEAAAVDFLRRLLTEHPELRQAGYPE